MLGEILSRSSRTDPSIIEEKDHYIVTEGLLRPGFKTVYSFLRAEALESDERSARIHVAVAMAVHRLQLADSGAPCEQSDAHIVLVYDEHSAQEIAAQWIKALPTEALQKTVTFAPTSVVTLASAINRLCDFKILLSRLSNALLEAYKATDLPKVPGRLLAVDTPYSEDTQRAPQLEDISDYLFHTITRSGMAPRSFALLGSFGSGKTTIILRTARRLSESAGSPFSIDLTQHNSVPFVFRALHLRQDPKDCSFPQVIDDFIVDAMHESVGFTLTFDSLKNMCRFVTPVIFVDGLDEARGLHKERDPAARAEAIRYLRDEIVSRIPQATVIFSARPELLFSRDQIGNAFPSLSSKTIYLGSPKEEHAKNWCEKAHQNISKLYNHLLQTEPFPNSDFQKTVRRPLYLTFLRELGGCNGSKASELLEAGEQMLGSAHLECLRYFVRKWSLYELGKAQSLAVELSIEEREWWVERLALLDTESEIEYPETHGGRRTINHLETLVELIGGYERDALNRLPSEHSDYVDNTIDPSAYPAEHSTEDVDARRILREAIAVSMFLVLDPSNDQVSFASRAVRQYLVARHFVPLFSLDTPKESTWKRRIRGHLGRINLFFDDNVANMLLLLIRDKYKYNLRQLADLICEEIRIVTSPVTGYSVWAPYRNLRSNLFLLLDLVLIDLGDYSVEFRGLDLSFIQFQTDKIKCLGNHLNLVHCNLEASEDLVNVLEASCEIGCYKGFSSIHSTPQRNASSNCDRAWKTIEFLSNELDAQKPISPQHTSTNLTGSVERNERIIAQRCLGKFVIIPGGQGSLSKHMETDPGDFRDEILRNISPTSVETAIPDDTFGLLSERDSSSSLSTLVPTFLLQEKPVSNRQFAYFVACNSEFEKLKRRKTLGNAYYLAGWDYTKYSENMNLYFHSIKEAIQSGNPVDPIQAADTNCKQRIGKKDFELFEDEWLEAPVVYVDWRASYMFTRFFGLRLPWEAEFEYAVRSYYAINGNDAFDPKNNTFDLSEIYKNRGDADVIPINTRSVVESWSAQQDFARQKCSNNDIIRDIPLDLLGRVWEWTREVWSAQWPPLAYSCDSLERQLAPNGRSFPIIVGNKDSALFPEALDKWGRSVNLRSRSIRGNSYLFAGENPSKVDISRRAPMPIMNVNHDIGFRCAADLRLLFSGDDNALTR
ncbi:MAG: SUMF1/EgtB/PvdO family nonheme iron enzyme [Candidatus Thiodiazotropha taylori]